MRTSADMELQSARGPRSPPVRSGFAPHCSCACLSPPPTSPLARPDASAASPRIRRLQGSSNRISAGTKPPCTSRSTRCGWLARRAATRAATGALPLAFQRRVSSAQRDSPATADTVSICPFIVFAGAHFPGKRPRAHSDEPAGSVQARRVRGGQVWVDPGTQPARPRRCRAHPRVCYAPRERTAPPPRLSVLSSLLSPLSQFLSMLAVFAPIVIWSDWVFFHFRVLPTRVVHDLQPKTHRF